MKRTLLALVLAIAAPFAEAAVWTTHGPRGGAIRSLAAAAGDHNVLYVTAADGVFRSDLRDGSWSDVTGPIEGPNEIAVSPADPNTVIVGASNGVFRSDDGGTSWQPSSGFVKGAEITRVLIDPHDPSVVYVGATGYEGAGVYKSVDGGRTFFDSSGSLPWWERWIEELALDPVAPDHLHLRYMYTDVFGYATSRDAGKSWSVTEYRSPSVPTRQILASPHQGGRRYGVGFGFWSSDDGETWSTPAGKLLQTSSTIYPPTVLAIDPAVPRLFGGTPFGAYRSGDGGNDWLPLGGAGQGDAVNGIDFDPASGAVVIGTDAGVFRSTAPWNAWTDLQLRNLSTPIENVAADPSNGDVYAVSGPRLFRSRDLGQSWQQAGPRLPFVIVRPWNTVSVYIGADHRVYAGYQRTVWRLRDGEDGWDVVRSALPTQDPAFFAHPRVPGMLYSAEGGIARSSDGGTTWTMVKTPLTALSVYADTGDPDILLCIGTNGSRYILIRSIDGGVSWSTIPTPASFAGLSFSGAPSAPNIIYMLLGTQFFARSDDHGATWSAPSEALYNLAPGSYVVSVVVDPRDPDVVYVSTTSGRVFVSKDGAGSWSELPSRPPGSTDLTLTIDAYGLFLHAGTRMRGVWEWSLTRRRATER